MSSAASAVWGKCATASGVNLVKAFTKELFSKAQINLIVASVNGAFTTRF